MNTITRTASLAGLVRVPDVVYDNHEPDSHQNSDNSHIPEMTLENASNPTAVTSPIVTAKNIPANAITSRGTLFGVGIDILLIHIQYEFRRTSYSNFR